MECTWLYIYTAITLSGSSGTGAQRKEHTRHVYKTSSMVANNKEQWLQHPISNRSHLTCITESSTKPVSPVFHF